MRSPEALEPDIAERERLEVSFRESEERLRLLVEGVKDYAIFMLDAERNILSRNAGAERIKGYRAEEVLGPTSPSSSRGRTWRTASWSAST
jgi:PAS domain-containing protein